MLLLILLQNVAQKAAQAPPEAAKVVEQQVMAGSEFTVMRFASIVTTVTGLGRWIITDIITISSDIRRHLRDDLGLPKTRKPRRAKGESGDTQK